MAKRNRNLGLGGTDAAAVLGLNPYASRFDVWLEKTGEWPSDFTENKFTHWGKLQEDVIAKHFAAEHKVRLIKSGVRQHPTRPWMFGSVDRLIEWGGEGSSRYDSISKRTLAEVGLEIKTGGYAQTINWGKPGEVPCRDDDLVPPQYWVQCQWYMEILDFPCWWLVVKLDSCDYREFLVKRASREEMNYALNECETFWRVNVVGKAMPEIDGGRNVGAYLTKTRPQANDTVFSADENQSLLIKDLLDAQERVDILKEATEIRAEKEDYRLHKKLLNRAYDELASIKNRCRIEIGTNGGLETEEVKVTWSTSKTGSRTLRTHKKKKPTK